VHCTGPDACQSGLGTAAAVECRASSCTVTCDQANACMDGIDVDAGGSCAAHCCNGACAGTVDAACTRDSVCI
jgi:hypothetical protein